VIDADGTARSTASEALRAYGLTTDSNPRMTSVLTIAGNTVRELVRSKLLYTCCLRRAVAPDRCWSPRLTWELGPHILDMVWRAGRSRRADGVVIGSPSSPGRSNGGPSSHARQAGARWAFCIGRYIGLSCAGGERVVIVACAPRGVWLAR